jgi:hypothetical protein
MEGHGMAWIQGDQMSFFFEKVAQNVAQPFTC